jgi:hypothetical protein
MAAVEIAVDRVTYVCSIDGCGEIVVQAEAVDTFS